MSFRIKVFNRMGCVFPSLVIVQALRKAIERQGVTINWSSHMNLEVFDGVVPQTHVNVILMCLISWRVFDGAKIEENVDCIGRN